MSFDKENIDDTSKEEENTKVKKKDDNDFPVFPKFPKSEEREEEDRPGGF